MSMYSYAKTQFSSCLLKFNKLKQIIRKIFRSETELYPIVVQSAIINMLVPY